MDRDPAAVPDFGKESVFLVWGPPSYGPRSRALAQALGISELVFVRGIRKRGLLWAPLKYACQAVQTLLLLSRRRPTIVFVQSPPGVAVLVVYVYCALTGSRYLVDAHSAAFLFSFWTRPRWLYERLARKAVATLVTNEYLGQMVNRWGGRAFVLPDIPTAFGRAESYPVDGAFSVAVVNSFGSDEPLQAVLEAAAGLDEVQFHITGRKSRARPGLLAEAPENVHFTDFLPDPDYYALLAASQAVMCLTTRDHTMQRGACEALWLAKPIITSDRPLLREYFHKGTVHVLNTPIDIRRGVLQMMQHRVQYQAEILELQEVQRRQWRERLQALVSLLCEATGARRARGNGRIRWTSTGRSRAPE